MVVALVASAAEASDAPPARAPDGATVGYVHRDKPAPLSVLRARNVALTGLFAGYSGMGVLEAAALGGVSGAFQATGKLGLAHNGLEDPANLIAREIAVSYATAHHLALARAAISVAEERQIVSKGATPAAGHAGQPAFVVEATSSTLASYFPFEWARYGVTFTSNVKVIDTGTGATVARAHCAIKPTRTPQSPTFKEMVADNNAVLKAMMARSAQTCLEQIRGEIAPDAGRPPASGSSELEVAASTPAPMVVATNEAAQAPADVAPPEAYSPPRRLPIAHSPGRVIAIRVLSDGSVVETRSPFD